MQTFYFLDYWLQNQKRGREKNALPRASLSSSSSAHRHDTPHRSACGPWLIDKNRKNNFYTMSIRKEKTLENKKKTNTNNQKQRRESIKYLDLVLWTWLHPFASTDWHLSHINWPKIIVSIPRVDFNQTPYFAMSIRGGIDVGNDCFRKKKENRSHILKCTCGMWWSFRDR